MVWVLSGEDFEIEAFCQHLGVDEDDKISNQELIPICSSLGIPNSLCEVNVLVVIY